jgi:MFS family permease
MIIKSWKTPLIVLIAGCLISMTGFGIRSSFGLFLEPMTVANDWSRETFGLAMALQNLLWGIGLPLAGALADKQGAVKVIIAGAIMYALGVWGMAESDSGTMLQLTGGVLTGLGIAFSAFTISMAAMVRVVGPEKRSFILGLGTAAGSFGQVLFSPISQGFISNYGWHSALLILASISLILIPMAMCLPSAIRNAPGDAQDDQTLKDAVYEAIQHRGFVLLTTGFFVCGFHVAFITVHFPAYIQDLGLDPAIGAYSIAIIGLMNIFGSFGAGFAGQKWSKKIGLSIIYFARAIVILGLILAPKTPTTMLVFSAAMGILWLSTVPLTTGIVAQVFGIKYMATLFGMVFFSHQIGSFMGVWLGGRIYDQTGSYDGIWWAGIVVGVLAGIVHIPINENPLARLKSTST